MIMDIPSKHFFTIGDVCKVTHMKPHVLRYWESRFKLLRPARRYSGHRKYSQADIDLINRIRQLVFDKKFSLAGAKKEISRQLNARPSWLTGKNPELGPNNLTLLRDIKKEVAECLEILSESPTQQELVSFK